MSLPVEVHELIEWELAVAYHQGYQAALADVAAARAELDATWRPVGRRGYERAVAERTAEMRRSALRLRAELDRTAGAPDGVPWPPVAEPGRPRRRRPARSPVVTQTFGRSADPRDAA